ncbi:hypothetical protein P9E76_01600 [Schinkia azotoformans]|uniref:Uncharacterized protein n=1 Tax=Schinkia azotoformans LMG 9581 TaxID=1131731 RepID=K6D4N8_SCHAZ|nr:hypothetical protein [Schinkia azotoformans]EKN67472.1 hypothetical protein BAZO_08281 [Schinkia azotoformans LMG 9581]MEC1637369.1 hypothetical protein [Schinkia azotoformans]MEC1943773.1 hypothetical protein [Schinkia azotoformans]
MSSPITPSVHGLIKKDADELREIISELKRPSLMKLCREAIHTIKGRNEYIDYIKRENEDMYRKLNRISEIIEQGRKELE